MQPNVSQTRDKKCCRTKQSRSVVSGGRGSLCSPICKCPVVSSQKSNPNAIILIPCPELPASPQSRGIAIKSHPFNPISIPSSPILSPAAEAWAILKYQFDSSS